MGKSELCAAVFGRACSLAVLVAWCANAHAGVAVCGPFTTDLLTAYQQGGDPFPRGVQDPDSGWTFHQGTPSGDLLTGLSGAGVYPAGFWGSATLLYNVPTGGPLMSPDPQINQVPFYRRPPSFNGVFLHPGATDSINGCAALHAQAPMVVTALSGQAEDVGSFDGIQVRVVRRSAGGDVDIVPFTFAGPDPSPAVALTPAPGALPIVLNPGDSLFVQSNRWGNEFEDWTNVNLSVTFTGGPFVPAPASVTTACNGRSTTLSVHALGTGLTYRWRRNGVNMSNTPGRYAGVTTASLTISALAKPDLQDRFDCVVTSSCSGFSVVSGEGKVASLLPDFNADGSINTADLTLLLARFGQAIPASDPIDINSDGLINTADLVAFLANFGRACP